MVTELRHKNFSSYVGILEKIPGQVGATSPEVRLQLEPSFWVIFVTSFSSSGPQSLCLEKKKKSQKKTVGVAWQVCFPTFQIIGIPLLGTC